MDFLATASVRVEIARPSKEAGSFVLLMDGVDQRFMRETPGSVRKHHWESVTGLRP